jgi:hypothetical protein
MWVLYTDALSRLDNDSLKIQDDKEEESPTITSGSEISSITNIKLMIHIYTTLILKKQAKVKDTGLRDKGLAQDHYSIQHILRV